MYYLNHLLGHSLACTVGQCLPVVCWVTGIMKVTSGKMNGWRPSGLRAQGSSLWPQAARWLGMYCVALQSHFSRALHCVGMCPLTALCTDTHAWMDAAVCPQEVCQTQFVRGSNFLYVGFIRLLCVSSQGMSDSDRTAGGAS